MKEEEAKIDHINNLKVAVVNGFDTLIGLKDEMTSSDINDFCKYLSNVEKQFDSLVAKNG